MDARWRTRKERRKRAQPPRSRRDCFGELIQIDGCDHEWFEERGPRCTLLVYVDDATSALMELRFTRTESTFDYFGWHRVMVLKPDDQRRTQFAVAKLGDKTQELMLDMDLSQRLPLTVEYKRKWQSMMCEAEIADIEF